MTRRTRYTLLGAIVTIALVSIVTAGLLSYRPPETPENLKYFTVWMTEEGFNIEKIEVKKGDTVILHIGTMYRPGMFGGTFTIAEYDVSQPVLGDGFATVVFLADKEGSYTFYLLEFPSIQGELEVKA